MWLPAREYLSVRGLGMYWDPVIASQSSPVTNCSGDGRSLAQEFYERRSAERRERRKGPDWFSAQDLIEEPWKRETRILA